MLLEALSSVQHHICYPEIDWCLTPILSIFQLYRGVNKFCLLISSFTRPLEIKTYFCIYRFIGRNIKRRHSFSFLSLNTGFGIK
jgi:hypothetical protein